jgi:high affinity sulfate transporter 1
MRRFPVQLFEGILPLDRARIPVDVLGGVTLAALAIPETMGYTKIAGMPVITGLYTILLPIAVFAIFGSSRHLVVGADSASAAILAAGLAGMAATGSSQYVALAGLVALLSALYLIIARLVHLGFLADFLSRTVLVGFLTGVGIQVAAGQVGGMFGVPEGTGGTLRKLWGTLQNLGDTSWWTLGVSVVVAAVILGTKYVEQVIPGALIAVVGSIIVSKWLDLEADGVAVLGPVPGGLPSFGLPDVDWTKDAPALAATAFAIFIVILAQSAATSRAYAAKHGDRGFDENVDLVGLGMANVAAGVSGTFVVNGSPTKTQMVEGAGGRSQIASLTCAGVVLIVLLFLTKPLQYMPEAVLSTVVFLIGIELIAVKGMRHIYRLRVDEFVVAAITAAVVVVVGVEQGILLAIVLSIVDHLRRGYRPTDTLVVPGAGGALAAEPVESGAQAAPGLAVYRFGASLYYANANLFNEEVHGVVGAAQPPLKWLCLDAAAISDVDYSAAQTLREAQVELGKQGVRLVLADVQDPVRRELDRYGFTDLVGAEAYFATVADAIAAFSRTGGR